MFVAINNKDMNIFKVDEWINTTRDANGGVISPEFAMELLSKTNFYGHIKKVLRNISEKCTTREQLMPYKEFILSSVDGREMSGEAFDYLCEMADLCECREEFDVANDKPKIYSKYLCERRLIAKTVTNQDELMALDEGWYDVYFDANPVDLYNCDLSQVEKLKFKYGAKVYLNESYNFPEVLDLSSSYLVDLEGCDFRGVKEIKFAKGAEVYLGGARNLPEVLDLSMDPLVVGLTGDNLCSVKKIKFRDEEQEKEFMNGIKNYSGKVVYVGENGDCEREKVEKKEKSGFGAKLKKIFDKGMD